MARLHDWQERLSAVLGGAAARAFAYGEHDCCLHAADCIEAVTGDDVAAAWRGQYSDEGGGMVLAKARSLAQLAARFLPPIDRAFARRGDVALAPIGERPGPHRAMMLLVVDGVVLRGPAGRFVMEIDGQPWRMSKRVRCWRVG